MNRNSKPDDIEFDSMIENGTDEESDSETEISIAKSSSRSNKINENLEAHEVDSSEPDDDDYDSLIENGTNESDSEIDISEPKNLTKVNKRKITDDHDVTAPKKKGKIDKELYKPPTVEELNQLRETENLFHSNLFRLQIEEMLQQVKVKDKYKKLFSTWFEDFQQCINQIEETSEFKLSDKKSLRSLNIEVPVDCVSKSTKGFYKFLKPSKISVVGSYAIDCCIGPNFTVDVAVEMPAKLFQKHDYQNHRYFRKRAIYLSYIAANIGEDLVESKKFTNLGDTYKPILKIVPTGKLSKRVTVHLHVVAQEGSFKLNRFLPEKNSVRTGWYFGEDHPEDDSAIPTPHYNSSVLHDLTMSQNNSRIIKTISEYPALRDGILLLKIWLHQRQLGRGYGSFTGHVLTMYVIHLMKIRQINNIMSSYQVIRNVWNSLALSNWCESGITLCQNDNSEPSVSEYRNHYDCVFIDTSGYHNLVANMNRTTFEWIKRQAELAVKCLDNVQINSFQTLFMTAVPFHRGFDHTICFHDTNAILQLVEKLSPRAARLDYDSNTWAQAVKLLVSTFQRGMNKRVSQIGVILGESEEWEITDPAPKGLRKIYIGFELNPEFCFSIVDKGPQANLPEAEEFRKFWGKKSELRRFQDGSICEAIVWGEGKTLAEKRSLCKRIIIYLLENKFSIAQDKFLYISDQMEELLKLKKVKVTNFAYGTGEEATIQMLNIFNELEKELTSLSDLPLTVTGVQGCSAVFRYTEVFPPLATIYRSGTKITKEGKNCLLLREKNLGMAPRYVLPIEAVIHLSLSGKWPEDLEAIRKIKAAFHIQIAAGLRKQYNLKAQGGLNYIDVMKGGFVFRLTVAHQKELVLLKQQIGDDGVIRYRDNEESIELEKKLFHLPKLTSALHGLHSQVPSFGPACCLAKRWLRAHLLDDSHIPDVIVELLFAAMYLAPEPYSPTQTPQVAFLRFLELLVKSYWNTEPIIVNFNNEMTRQEIVEIESYFNTNRSMLPSLFISTPYDKKNSLWTRKKPSLVILKRITTLARASLKIIEKQIYDGHILNHRLIFKAPMTEYDFLINLRPFLNPRRLQDINLNDDHPMVEWHPHKSHSMAKIPVVDFNPVQIYLQELRENYEEYALFFHDTFGGHVIGVLIKPSALEPKEFKVSNVNCRKITDDGKLVLNVSAMLEDFYVLGKGLVRSIDTQSKKDYLC
ncbi:nucleolar protein 6 isoform X1 [Neodiprion virginianus]|uniref:nucleolar protein 6 isoform X1 n=1 Tax=Neodiprion virginianus TaxID=2961670 RepID=UPI001EE73F14|nr:nucleolar protein 6 isoform X1 [Neodiprion virginianus]